MSQTILITGGSGFIGSRVARLLAERGETIINFDMREPGAEAAWWLKPVADRVRFVPGGIDNWADVISAVKTHQPEVLVLIAAITNPVLLHTRPGLAMNVNLGGTFNFLEAARLFGVRRVIYFSSIGALTRVQYEPIDANHPLILATEGPGASFYAAAKVSGEAFCWAYNQAYNLDFITIRLSAVYGFGQQYPIFIKPMVENAVNNIATSFAQGREFPRDYTHVADVAQLTVKAIDIPAHKVQDRIFYAATGQPLVTAGAVADIVQEYIPNAAIEIGSGLSETDLIEIRYRGILSIQNAQEQLGYQPDFTDIRTGIKDYVDTYRRYLANSK